jgi:hypothetical protein
MRNYFWNYGETLGERYSRRISVLFPLTDVKKKLHDFGANRN